MFNKSLFNGITLKAFNIFCCCCALLFLTACQNLPKTDLVPVQVNQISEAKAWELRGKILIKTPEDKNSTNLYWRHTATGDQLALTTMLGTSVLNLESTPFGAKLTMDGKDYQSTNPEALLLRMTGWSVPVSLLPKWITGQIQPSEKVMRDSQGRPKQFTSIIDGVKWQLTYVRWQRLNGVELPRQLTLSRPNLSLKIQLNQWQALALQGSK
ncbi:lipoprotein insertase outer membrane protein LolB [Parashewanella tropica]|uniref:lipoprotein insertase outer membrane protein LolB n=1 Tax=Parashewanella tropica TaxID=2547970 RepID=UPI00105A7E91|nr:lipoprotein insertase outer membrane protein LolB [Parashewanella tropica]